MEQMNEERVKQRAYEIWEAEGCPSGRDEAHWQQAIAEVAAKDAYGLQPEQVQPVHPDDQGTAPSSNHDAKA